MKKNVLFVLALIIFFAVTAYAEPLFDQIYFKTRSTLIPGTYTLRFSIWDAVSKGGTMVWSETHAMTLTDQTISDYLGDLVPLPDLDYNMPWYVQVDSVIDLKMKPISKTRERLNISQYSLWSFESIAGSTGFDADTVDGLHASSFALASHAHNYDSSYVNASGDTMTGDLVMDTGANGDLTISEDKISRAGDLTIDANNSNADTKVDILNSDETYKADLNIEGNITAANFTGDGSGLDNVIPAAHNHSGNDITSGTVGETYVDAAIARDSEVASAVSAHTSNASAHHTRYSDAEAVSAIKVADGSGSTLDADLLDGNDSTAFAVAAHTHDYDPSYVNISGDTMSGPLTLTQLNSGSSGEVLSINAANGAGNGGALNLTAGSAGTATGGSGGDLTLKAGGNMPQGGAGWSNVGPTGNVSITAGGGYNTVGGNVSIASGATSYWSLSHPVYSKVSILGGVAMGGDGASIDVEGGHSPVMSAVSSGGNVLITGGNAVGGYSGGNIILSPGTGSPNGMVGIGTSSPGAKLDVLGEIRTNNQLISTIPTGNSPLKVDSTTMVTNLNSEMIGGYKLADLDNRYGQTAPSQIPRSNTISTVLPSSGINDGLYSSITIGVDGLPVVAYFDATKGYLMIGKCSNSACSSFSSYTYTASQGYMSIAIGTDGLPLIAHMSGGGLYVAKCADTGCSSLSSNVGLTSTSGHISMAIGTDGIPIIAHSIGGGLYVSRCNNASCTSGLASNSVFMGTSGYISMAIGTDGYPIISHLSGGTLYTQKCTNAACTSGPTITGLAGSGGHTSIAIGNDGLPVISHYAGSVLVYKCGNTYCNGGAPTHTALDGGAGWTSVTVGTDGLPAVANYGSGATLRYIKCGNAGCTANNTVNTVDPGAGSGQYNSITLGTDGNPVISYYDAASGELKIAKCSNQFCINNWSRR